MAVDPSAFAALFEPRGVLVAGVSTHPGKFGFVSLHNILASGYQGVVYGSSREAGEVLGVPVVADIAELPDDAIDLVFVCTPAAANPELLRACAKKGIRAAFLASAGYGEAGDEGQRLQEELVALAGELGMLVAGPNGQGVVSTPASLCAQIVAPYPPAGSIGIASQSGNFISSFMNYAVQTGVGVSRAVSAGNAAAVTIPDYLDYYAVDEATRVGLAYVEGVPDGRTFFEHTRAVAARKPLVLVKGGATAGGSARRPPTPVPWRATTGCSTACAAKPASRAPRRSRRRSRQRRRSPPNRSRRETGWWCSPPPVDGESSRRTPSLEHRWT